MAYVNGEIVHDADTHIMELPYSLDEFIEPEFKDRLREKIRGWRKRNAETDWADEVVARHDDPEFRKDADENIMLRKKHDALGSFRKEDRSHALNLLGFASQLVFTTFALGNFGLDHGDDVDLTYAAARAHNRMMLDFCSVDRRLLPTAYVPIADRARAIEAARDAIAQGFKGLMIPSMCPKGFSPSHVELDGLWQQAEDAGLPILFHVGGQEKMNLDYARNGLPAQLDWLGGAENFTSVSFMTISQSIEQTLSTMIFDGVLDRFPNLKFGVVEMGASWVPSLMKTLDTSYLAFGREERLQRLSARPSEIFRRQVRVTPFPHEDIGWIINNAGEEVCLFSSDYPHIEGGRNPIKRFDDSLAAANVSERARARFYRNNMVDLMGKGLDPSLDTLPDQHLAAA